MQEEKAKKINVESAAKTKRLH